MASNWSSEPTFEPQTNGKESLPGYATLPSFTFLDFLPVEGGALSLPEYDNFR